jgi:ATP-dependent DNA helicase RecQ
MKPNGEFEKLLKDPLFTSYLIGIIIDEAHCITEWGEFRPEYPKLGHLQYILPSTIFIMMASATLTKAALTHTTRLLHMHTDKMVTIHHLSDRLHIKIGVRKSSAHSVAMMILCSPSRWVGRLVIHPHQSS